MIYLVIGKTHPEVLKRDGEKYRNFLYEKVHELHLENNVRFINKYLSLEELMDYLERTKVYLFTSKDPNQAVSGTLVYAMACGCPVIATPIPHAKEFLQGAGFNYDFLNANQLAEKTIELLYNPKTGGCYDGLEQYHVNLNQGAESTISYLLSRLTMENVVNPIHETVFFEEAFQNE